MLSKLFRPRVMEKYDESGIMKISQVFGTFNMLTVEGCSGTALFKEFTNRVFDSL